MDRLDFKPGQLIRLAGGISGKYPALLVLKRWSDGAGRLLYLVLDGERIIFIDNVDYYEVLSGKN